MIFMRRYCTLIFIFVVFLIEFSLCTIEVFNYFKFFHHRCGFNPETILDVGASYGEWTRKMLDLNIFLYSQYFMVEANEGAPPHLSKLGVSFEITLIGDYTGTSKFYIQRDDPMGQGNSRFRENSGFFENPVEVEYPITTIDELVERRKLGRVHLLKLDIQGGEFAALLGAKKTLIDVEVIQIECSFIGYNQGSPPMFDLFALLQSFGFDMYGISEIIGSSTQPIQFDAIFVKRTSSLWNKNCSTYPPPKPSMFNVLLKNSEKSEELVGVVEQCTSGECLNGQE